jgi:chemotaxis protein CheX
MQKFPTWSEAACSTFILASVVSIMRADILNAFLDAGADTIARETRSPVQRGKLLVDPSEQLTDDITVYVALVGRFRGMVLLGMPKATGRQIASTMIGEEQKELNELSLSALAELGNLIAGASTMALEKIGLPCDITPPTIMIGRSRISTLGLARFIIPLTTTCGLVHIHVAVDVAQS